MNRKPHTLIFATRDGWHMALCMTCGVIEESNVPGFLPSGECPRSAADGYGPKHSLPKGWQRVSVDRLSAPRIVNP